MVFGMKEFSGENIGRPKKTSGDSKNGDERGNATPVCPDCLRPVNPRAYYCPNCESNETINPLASYMPFVRIRFGVGMVGKLWRHILYDKRSNVTLKVLYLFLIVLWLLSLGV